MKKKSTTNKLSKGVKRAVLEATEKVSRERPLTNKFGRVRELQREDIRAMRPASEVLPKKLLDVLPKRKRGERGPQKEPKKVAVTLRYSREVVSYFKSTGEGWQVRMDNVLKKYIKQHPKPLKNDEEHHKHLKRQKQSRNVA